MDSFIYINPNNFSSLSLCTFSNYWLPNKVETQTPQLWIVCMIIYSSIEDCIHKTSLCCPKFSRILEFVTWICIENYIFCSSFHYIQILSLNLGEIRELCGCDLLTISPKLLGELQDSTDSTPVKLSPEIGMIRDSFLLISSLVLWYYAYIIYNILIVCILHFDAVLIQKAVINYQCL